MAESLNRQFIRKINKIIEDMDISEVDPFDHYSHLIGEKQSEFSFTLTKIGMSKL